MQIKSLCSLAVIALFAGCGGGGGDGGGSPVPVEPTVKKAPALCPTCDNGTNYECPPMTGFNGDESATINTQGNARVERIEFAQLNLKQPDSQYFVAIANRDALIRVVVTADAGHANLKAPALKLTLTNLDTGAVVMQTTLQPATSQMVLPTSGDAIDAVRGNTTVPDLYRSYLYRLPAANVPASNLQLKADIDTIASGMQDTVFVDNSKIVNLKPVVVPVLKLVTVPIHVSGTVPTIPSDELLKQVMMKYLPVSDVQIRQHTPLFVSDSALGGIAPERYSDGGSAALLQINNYGKFFALPTNENSADEIYIGLVRGRVGGLTLFHNAILTADLFLGEFNQSVLPHELLHTVDFQHQAICGASNPIDQSYPYADGSLNGIWGIEITPYDSTLRLKSPNKFKSIMAYCYPSYTSDYHIQGFAKRFGNN
jgi:hypothetical protein